MKLRVANFSNRKCISIQVVGLHAKPQVVTLVYTICTIINDKTNLGAETGCIIYSSIYTSSMIL